MTEQHQERQAGEPEPDVGGASHPTAADLAEEDAQDAGGTTRGADEEPGTATPPGTAST